MTAELQELDRIQGVLEPTGFRILVRIPNLSAQMARWANLEMPEETRRQEEFAQLVGQVIMLGPDAYKDETKFPTGAWCAEGDYVVLRAYAGTRFTMQHGEETSTYSIINDDSVQARVRGDYRAIERVG